MKKLFVVFVFALLLAGCETEPEETNVVMFESYGGNDIESIEVVDGKSILEPDMPQKDGYDFLGWYSDSTFNDSFDFSTPVVGDLQLHAKWESNQYIVEYLDYDGTVLQSKNYDVGADLSSENGPNRLFRLGYTFTGWDITLPSVMGTEKVTVNAVYEVNQFVVEFIDYDGTVFQVESYDFGADLSDMTPPTGLVKEGFTFSGWHFDYPTTMPNHDVTIIAMWDSEVMNPNIPEDGIFSNKNLRLALSYSIDREFITATMGSAHIPAGGLIPPGFLDNDGFDFFETAGTHGLETDDTNYAEAVTLFANAANEMGMTVAQLQYELETQELLYNTSEGHKTIAQLVQLMWYENLGFMMPLANEEWAVFQQTRMEGNFDIARGGWLTDFMDPVGILSIFGSYSAYNDPNYYNATFDSLLASASATTDMADHFAMLYDANELFMNDMPIIPIYHYSDYMMASDAISGWGRSVLGAVDFSQAAITGNVLNWNIGSNPQTLDPSRNGSFDGGNVINQTFEGLVREINGEVLPGIAESWIVSADGLTVTFNLRDSNWSDGTPLTAHDFVYGWLHGMDPATQSEFAWIWEYTNIVGAVDYAYCSETNCAAERAAVGISATDDNTFVVELITPTSYLPSLTTFYHFMPLKQSAVESGSEGIWAKDPAVVVSNGPYVLTAYSEAGLTLEKNAEYWNVASVSIMTINGQFIDDAVSAYAAYQIGELDFIPSVPTAEVNTLLAESHEFYVFPFLGTYYYSFNMDQDKDGVNE